MCVCVCVGVLAPATLFASVFLVVVYFFAFFLRIINCTAAKKAIETAKSDSGGRVGSRSRSREERGERERTRRQQSHTNAVHTQKQRRACVRACVRVCVWPSPKHLFPYPRKPTTTPPAFLPPSADRRPRGGGCGQGSPPPPLQQSHGWNNEEQSRQKQGKLTRSRPVGESVSGRFSVCFGLCCNGQTVCLCVCVWLHRVVVCFLPRK